VVETNRKESLSADFIIDSILRGFSGPESSYRGPRPHASPATVVAVCAAVEERGENSAASRRIEPWPVEPKEALPDRL
jgi:hypothetical protein